MGCAKWGGNGCLLVVASACKHWAVQWLRWQALAASALRSVSSQACGRTWGEGLRRRISSVRHAPCTWLQRGEKRGLGGRGGGEGGQEEWRRVQPPAVGTAAACKFLTSQNRSTQHPPPTRPALPPTCGSRPASPAARSWTDGCCAGGPWRRGSLRTSSASTGAWPVEGEGVDSTVVCRRAAGGQGNTGSDALRLKGSPQTALRLLPCTHPTRFRGMLRCAALGAPGWGAP